MRFHGRFPGILSPSIPTHHSSAYDSRQGRYRVVLKVLSARGVRPRIEMGGNCDSCTRAFMSNLKVRCWPFPAAHLSEIHAWWVSAFWIGAASHLLQLRIAAPCQLRSFRNGENPYPGPFTTPKNKAQYVRIWPSSKTPMARMTGF